MYNIDREKLTKRPEIRIGDKIYSIDNRLSTFQRMRKELDESQNMEMETVISFGLGHDVYLELLEMDLPFSVMEEIVIIILAGIQDLEVDKARQRFQNHNA